MQAAQDVFNRVVSVYGLPPVLFGAGQQGSSSGVREAMRSAFFTIIAPAARTLRAEARVKLDPGIDFDMDGLMAADVQGRARAFQSMVGAGLPVEQAAQIAGVVERGD